jgi:hypothetical protein
MGDPDAGNVEAQRSDPRSVLVLAHDLITLRRGRAELRTGAYRSVAAPAGVWAFRRGDHILIVANLSDDPAILDGVEGRILVSSDRGRDGEDVVGLLRLSPWEAVVTATGTGTATQAE